VGARTGSRASSASAGARRAAAHPGPSTGPRGGGAPLSTADRLARVGDRLDALQRDASVGAHSHREFERQAGEAEALSAELRAIFRGPPAGAPRNPPLWQRDGKAAW